METSLPTSQIDPLLNSVKINSETNSSLSEEIGDFINKSDDDKKEDNKEKMENSEEKENSENSENSENNSDNDGIIEKNNEDDDKLLNDYIKSSESESKNSSDSNDNDKNTNIEDSIENDINNIINNNNKKQQTGGQNNNQNNNNNHVRFNNFQNQNSNQNPNMINEINIENELQEEERDPYEYLTEGKKRLARMDLLRKLAELKRKGYLITEEYNINSDYYAMKEEYEYQMTIKGKDNFVKQVYNGGSYVIRAIEYANKRFDPFGIDLEGWNTEIESSKEDLLDAIGELYEKYHKPGSGQMSPELRILIIFIQSAVSTIIANSGAKILASMFNKKPAINNDDKQTIMNNIAKQQQEMQEKMQQQPKISQPVKPKSLSKSSTDSDDLFDSLVENQKNSKK